VLGTANGQQGAGARQWAASTPNLLNVAVTRAKCRLYVIGNASAWNKQAYLRELYRMLPMRPVESQTFSTVDASKVRPIRWGVKA